MSNPPSIAILHYAGPPVIGGVEATIAQHARRLAEQGFPVRVIAGRGDDFTSQVRFTLIPEIDSRHPRVLEVGQQLGAGKVTEQFYDLRDQLVGELASALAGVEVCIVHNILTLHKNLALTAALERMRIANGCRLIAWCHDFAWQDPLYTPSLHPGYPWGLLRSPWQGVKYVTVSDSRREALSELMGLRADQISVVPPGIDSHEFLAISPLTQKLASRMDLPNLDPFLLLPARITRRKNIELAIRVTAALQASLPQASLVITGPPGPHNPKNVAYLKSLDDLAEQLGIRPSVHFLYEYGSPGEPFNLPDEVVADLFRLADLLIFPSLREGFGIPILEAGLARLPVFAADIPPFRETAGHLIRTFNPQGEPQGIARQIDAFLKQDQAYLLKRRVIANFDWQAIIQQKVIPLIRGM